jgi:hypothetical protein
VGGPSFFIHLPRPLSLDAIERLDARVRREMLDVTRTQSNWDFWPEINSCQCSLAVVPFSCESMGNGQFTEPTMEDDQIAAITAALGYQPAQSLQFNNYCRSDLDGHRLLARFGASLAAEYEGVADIGGTTPPISYERLPGVHHLPTGNYLLEPEVFERWCGERGFYLET